MTDTHTHDQMCQQHDKPTAVYEGFKVAVIVRGKPSTRYCHPECLESLKQFIEVVSVEPFSVKPLTKEDERRRRKLYRQSHKKQRRAYWEKYYEENYTAISNRQRERYQARKEKSNGCD